MEIKRYVIDASVALKWVLDEKFQADAERYLLSPHDLIAPDIFKYECSNVFAKKVRNGSLQSELGWRFYQEIILSEVLEFIPTDHLLQKAYQESIELDHPVFDCLYLALADEKDAVVITADEAFYKKISKSRIYSNRIQWVEELP